MGERSASELRAIEMPPPGMPQVERSPDDDASLHWQVHSMALAHDRLAESLFAAGRLPFALVVWRQALALRHELAALPGADPLFSENVDVRVEIAANHLAMGLALKRARRLPEALAELRAGIDIYRMSAESSGDAAAFDTVAEELEEAGRVAREIPGGNARELFAQSLEMRQRAAMLAPNDDSLARAFIEACVWRAPDLGRASVGWLDRARGLIESRVRQGTPLADTARLRRLVDTAGAPSAQG